MRQLDRGDLKSVMFVRTLSKVLGAGCLWLAAGTQANAVEYAFSTYGLGNVRHYEEFNAARDWEGKLTVASGTICF